MQYLQSFALLSQLLRQNNHWWQFQPFHFVQSRWQQIAPELAQYLAQLPLDELQVLASDPAKRVQQLQVYIPDLEALFQLCQLPKQNDQPPDVSPHWQTGIPGKKWQQIQAFSQDIKQAGPVLEWCAGKGHLGRYLALLGHSQITSLEWQQALCDDGQRMAEKSALAQQFHQQDVFADDTRHYLQSEQTAVALHACGDLHQRLITLGSEQQLEAMYLSPCCYHLIQQEYYQPLSKQGQQRNLQLSKADLSMCLRQTVTGGARVKRLRQQELLWRLSFDCLQRQLRQTEQYMPLPTISGSILSQSFEEFVHWSCQRKQLPTATTAQIQNALAQGQQRLRANQEMELVQHCFQRPVEIWLALDKVLYLQQQGYEVELSEFCHTELTPRNLKISAHKLS